jgi:KDO2-lipid IV(A) lauroyltransferase
MKKNAVIYYVVFGLWYLVSLLPLRLLYVISDLLYLIVCHGIHYRRRVIRKNLAEAFPEKSEAERLQIEHGFYRFFCDYMMETVKMLSMSKKQMERRMTYGGMDRVRRDLTERDCILYLGHYCNWEWIASISHHLRDMEYVKAGQIYHELQNKTFDRLFLHSRGRFGGLNIEMHQALRTLVRLRQQRQRYIIGFISDQSPSWNYVNMWTDFLNHKTSFFVGAENIAKLTDATVYYVDVRRVKRGYYHAEFIPMTDAPKSFPNYELTVEYGHLLEQTIRREPQYWLWSHNRWKRTYDMWMEMQECKQQQ